MAVKNYGIHDKWTNINKVNNVEIQSVDGVIENIKVNGEPAGGGDFSTAQVTVIDSQEYETPLAFIDSTHGIVMQTTVGAGVYTIPLYQGKASIFANPESVSGHAEIKSEGISHYVEVTGDCTITIS